MKSNRSTFFLIFTLSGFSGLIYESIWTHYLKLFLGHAAYAQSLVLAIFMGGLTAGSWLCSSYSGSWNNLLRGYALAEGAIGILALLFHPIFSGVVRFSLQTVMPALPTPAAAHAFSWSISAILILPQTILLGMTFPLMSSALLRRFPASPGRTLAMLYFTNSVGAAVGVLVSGFFLIRAVGLPGTIVSAGMINIGLAITVWILAREDRQEMLVSIAPQETESAAADTPRSAFYRLLLAASLLTGLASFLYEIGWIRMLSLVLGSSTHSFELMLSAFIFGLAFGGLWLQRRIDALGNPVVPLIIVQIAMGLLALATIPLYGASFDIMQWLVTTLPKTDLGYALFNLSGSAIALAIMLPATFCAGMTLPLITLALIRKGHGEKSIGAVYAMNTLGAIIGVFAAIHLAMPLLGLKGLMAAGAVLDIGLGVFLLWHLERRLALTQKALGTGLACMAAIGLLYLQPLDPYKMASGVYRGGSKVLERNASGILYHKDGKTATVSVTETRDNGSAYRSIRTNGKIDASINVDTPHRAHPDESTMVLAAVLPLAYHPGARTAANIGLGSGLTSHTLLADPRLERVDTVEIEREMAEASRRFGPLVERTYRDARSIIHIDDAKTFFSSHNRTYDIIVSEPSNPWVSGVAGLFSQEFYALIGRRLAQDGIFVQWVQLYEIDAELVASVFKALSPQFSDFAVYAPNFGDLIIVAKKSGALSAPNPALLELPGIAESLRSIQINGVEDLDARRIGTKSLLAPAFDRYAVRPNSDYYPVLDQNAARTRYLEASAQDIAMLGNEPLPIREMLSSPGAPLRDTTLVTLSTSHPRTRSMYAATALHDYFLRNSPLAPNSFLDAGMVTGAAQTKSILRDCQPSSDPNRRVHLFNTAKSMVPYLAPAEAARVIATIETARCYHTLSPAEAAYVALFKAIGARDGKGMADAAAWLLEHEQDITPARLRYVGAAGMLGNLASGNHQGAEDVRIMLKAKTGGSEERSFLFRVLEGAMATAGLRGYAK